MRFVAMKMAMADFNRKGKNWHVIFLIGLPKNLRTKFLLIKSLFVSLFCLLFQKGIT